MGIKMKAKLTKVISAASVILLMACVMACGSREVTGSAPTAVTETAEENQASEDAAVPTAEDAVIVPESTEVQQTEEEAVKLSAEGMVIDAAIHSLSIMTEGGDVLFFSYPEDGAAVELEDGILLGEVVNVIHTGSNEAGNAVAVEITAGDTETVLDREAYEFAIKIINFAKFNDLEGLAGVTAYPVFVDMGDIDVMVNNEGDFKSIERLELMSLGGLADYNLFNMVETQEGIIIGEGKPNMIFAAGEDGYAITGINVE